MAIKRIDETLAVNLFAVPELQAPQALFGKGFPSPEDVQSRLGKGTKQSVVLWFAQGMGKLIENWIEASAQAREVLRRFIQEDLVYRRRFEIGK